MNERQRRVEGREGAGPGGRSKSAPLRSIQIWLRNYPNGSSDGVLHCPRGEVGTRCHMSVCVLDPVTHGAWKRISRVADGVS